MAEECQRLIFEPAISSAYLKQFLQNQWLYCIAPPLGAIAAVGIFRLVSFGEREPLTAKLFHVPHYICIFKNVKVPHRTNNLVEVMEIYCAK